jgi:hypothetical protein
MPVPETALSPNEEKHYQCNHDEDYCSNLVFLSLRHGIVFRHGAANLVHTEISSVLWNVDFFGLSLKTMPSSINKNWYAEPRQSCTAVFNIAIPVPDSRSPISPSGCSPSAIVSGG